MEDRCACKGTYFDKLIQPAVLVVLSEGPSYGLEILNKIQERSITAGGAPDAAGFYRMLKKMEESGLMTAEWVFNGDSNKPRKMLTITEDGIRCISNWRESLVEYRESIDHIINAIDKIPAER